MISSLRYVFFDLFCLRLRSFLFRELLLLGLLSLLGGHDDCDCLPKRAVLQIQIYSPCTKGHIT